METRESVEIQDRDSTFHFEPWFRRSETLAEANQRLSDFAHAQTQREKDAQYAKCRRRRNGRLW